MSLRAAGAAMALAVMLALMVVTTQPAQAQTYTFKVLYSFQGGADGGYPYSSLLLGHGHLDRYDGMVYGTTYQGGLSNLGTIFQVDTNEKKENETVLYSFSGSDGANPVGALALGYWLRYGDGWGIVGTTEAGGSFGYGTVFGLGNNTLDVFYNFAQSDGASPMAGLAPDYSTNDFFGTTETGGANGFGTVFQVDSSLNLTTVHDFAGAPTDGAYPFYGALEVRGVSKHHGWAGFFYGTTEAGGTSDAGTVFKLNPNTGAVTILWSFTGGTDGGYPYGPVILDKKGILWGTTSKGGAHGFGTVFEIRKGGKYKVVYSFSGGADGATPYGGLAPDCYGNHIGTTLGGGANGDGTVFQISTTGTETVLHSFACATDGCSPNAGLVQDETHFGGSCSLRGTNLQGGTGGYGTVYQLTPQ